MDECSPRRGAAQGGGLRKSDNNTMPPKPCFIRFGADRVALLARRLGNKREMRYEAATR